MSSKQKIKAWRAELIAKIALGKSSFNLSIESFPGPVFDFYIAQADNPRVRFAAEVKTKNTFKRDMQQQWSRLATYRNHGMMTIPAVIIKVDEPNETAELDFLVTPLRAGKLSIKRSYSFKKLTPENLDAFVNKIKAWWKQNDGI
jgi:hypothetical protein